MQKPFPFIFAEKLNKCLNDIDAPTARKDRAEILSKLFHVSKQQAWDWLERRQIPSPEIIQKIASEFEVDIRWLNGE